METLLHGRLAHHFRISAAMPDEQKELASRLRYQICPEGVHQTSGSITGTSTMGSDHSPQSEAIFIIDH